MSPLLRTGRRVAATITLAPALLSARQPAPAKTPSYAAPADAPYRSDDPAATARRVKTPVLILTGANDQQAPPEQVPEQQAAFLAAGNRDVTAHVVAGVNHLFVVDADGYPGNYAKLPAPVRIKQEVVGEVVDWLAIRLAARR